MENITKLLWQMVPIPRVMDELNTLPGWPEDLEVQESVHKAVLEDPHIKAYPLASDYVLRWLKTISAALEKQEQEVCEPMLRTYLELMHESPPSSSYVTFTCQSHRGDGAKQVQPGKEAGSRERPKHKITCRIAPKENEVGLRLWEAGFVLADYLMDHPEVTAGKKVIELGAGVGLLGLVAALCTDARSVVVTDGDPEVVKFIRHNVEITFASLGEQSSTLCAPLDVTGLDWSTQEDRAKLLSLASPTSQDGQGSHSCQSVIMAADVVYDHDVIAGLVDALAYVMEQLGTKTQDLPDVLIASTIRNEKTYGFFMDSLSRRGLQVEDLRAGGPPENTRSPFVIAEGSTVQLSRISVRQ